jgi:hypothetical protein
MKQKPNPAPAYKPTGLVRPTLEELRNGFAAKALTAYLRKSCGTDYEFCEERLNRADHYKQICAKAVAEFKRTEDLTAPAAKRQLAKLEDELSEAEADANYAADRLMEIAA